MAFQLAFLLTGTVFIASAIAIILQGYRGINHLCASLDDSWNDLDRALRKLFSGIDELEQIFETSPKTSFLMQRLHKARSKYSSTVERETRTKLANEILIALIALIQIGEENEKIGNWNQFSEMKASFIEIEREISVSAEGFNSIVKNYNSRISMFPEIFLAKLLGCRPMECIADTCQKIVPSERHTRKAA